MSRNINRANRRTEQGMVSIIITMVMMLVISLIVLGFAQVSRREERTALDTQLSTQAYFAAETGLNDAYNAIESTLAGGHAVEEKNYCMSPVDPMNPTPNPHSIYAPYNPTVDSATNVSYSCLLVTTHLPNIVASVGADGSSVTVPLHPESPNHIQNVDLEWKALNKLSSGASGTCSNTVPGSAYLPVGTGWSCPYSLLRIDIVPTDTLNRGNLLASQQAVFFYPTTRGASSVNYSSLKGTVQPMLCDDTSCKVTIKAFPAGTTNYEMRISAVYQSGGTLSITADKYGGGSTNLADAQVAIDSTGKAQDVLRRIQARLPLVKTSDTNLYALESGSSICKHFGVGSSSITIDGIIGQDSNNPYCDTLTAPPPVCLTDCTTGSDDSAVIVTFCDLHPCDPGNNNNSNAKPKYTAFIGNESPIASNRIIGCEWDMGDGKSVDSNGLKNQHCYQGNSFTYTYPANPLWKTCRDVTGKTKYTVRLTEIVQGGTRVPSDPQNVYVPSNCHPGA